MKSFIKKFAARSQAGDTIVEVLISICILSVVLTGSYVVANRSLQTGTESAQRSEALALAQKQIEYIKYAANDSTAPTGLLSAYEPATGAPFCIVGTNPLGTPIQPTACQQGAIPYKISTSYNKLAFTVTVSWDAVNNTQPENQMTLYYKLPGSYEAPQIQVYDVTDYASTSATLSGSINPNGNTYTYYFQYGTTTNFGTQKPVPPGGPFGDKTNHPVSVSISGLMPGTKYYFQLCLTDSICKDGSSFTTYGKPFVSMSANPSVINPGDTTTIAWTPTNVSSCTASGSWSGAKSPFPDSTNIQLNTPGTYTYALDCIGLDPSTRASGSTSVTVRPPPTLSFTADSYSLSYNGSTTLHWRTTNATWCWGSGGTWGGGIWKNASGGDEGTGALTSSQTYYLQCGGISGSTPTQSVAISVSAPPPPPTPPPLPTISISVNPIYHSNVNSGTCADGHHNWTRCNATWTASNATYCELSNWQGILASGNPNGGQYSIVGWNVGAYVQLTVNCWGSGGTGSATWTRQF